MSESNGRSNVTDEHYWLVYLTTMLSIADGLMASGEPEDMELGYHLLHNALARFRGSAGFPDHLRQTVKEKRTWAISQRPSKVK